MSDREHPTDRAALTAVLVTVPEPVAERLASFLRANGVACATRPAAAEGAVEGAGWDVLVADEGLPEAPAEPTQPTAAERRPEPMMNILPPQDVAAEETAPESPAILCELPWEQAWALSHRLIEAGIPAAVMEAEKPDRERPMQARVVPVGVRPEDVERARSFVAVVPPPAPDDQP